MNMTTFGPSDNDLPCAIPSQLARLIGLNSNFRNPDGSQMYGHRTGSHGQELSRLGTTSNCIIYGMPDASGVLSFARIHRHDGYLSLHADVRRVFSLCWSYYHGGYRPELNLDRRTSRGRVRSG